MCIGVWTLPQKHPSPLFFAKPAFKPANCPSPPFLGNSPQDIVFFRASPQPRNRIFQWTPVILKFSSFTPSLLLKVTKFLDKISQFEFLVTAEKNIFVYKLFLSLNISDFSFLCKNCNPPKKVTPLRSCQGPPSPFENLVGGSSKEVHTMYFCYR